jgi:energy-coupling factor transport system ATP-binding protein
VSTGAGGRSPTASVEQVEFSYRGSVEPALRGVDLTLGPGQMIGIMGASGAGKSTLAKCLNRLVPSFEAGDFRGLVRIGGRPVDGSRVCDLAATVGMVFQDFEAQLFATNAGLEVAFAMQQVGMPRDEIVARVGPALAAVGLIGFESRDPTSLSGGEKQRLAIAAVLALRPQLIVFDEPTTDLDPEGRSEVLALIRSMRGQGVALVVIEHDAEELRECDRLLLMRSGEIVAEGPPAQLLTRLELLEDCGVRPPDLNRALASLGVDGSVGDISGAERKLRAAGFGPAAAVAPPRAPQTAAPALVETRQLSFAYTADRPVLDGIELRIATAEFVAIVGQNGSGKTTLAKLLTGLLKPTRGRVLLDGRDRAELAPAESAHLVGYVFQNPDHQIFASTVEEEVAFGPRNFGLAPEAVEERTAEVLHAVNLEHARARDPFLLSKGERQRLAVASILALRPRLLILDEPTTGLDYREQRRMMTLVTELNRSGIAIVIITHTPWLVAEYARRVVLMRKGRVLFDGAVREFFAQDELLQGSSFRAPEVTRLARQFGFSALNVAEFVAAMRSRPASSQDGSRC